MPPQKPESIRVLFSQHDGDHARLDLSGRLDVWTLAEAWAAAVEPTIRQRPAHVAVDLSKLTYLGGASLALFAELRRVVSEWHGEICFCGMQRAQARLMEHSALSAPRSASLGHRDPPICDSPIIQVEDLRAQNGERHLSSDNLTFDIPAKEVFVIAGGSACIKAALMSSLAGLRTPASGRVLIDGLDLYNASSEARRVLRHKIGVISPHKALCGRISALQNVLQPLKESTELEDGMANTVAMTKLRLLGVEHVAARLPDELNDDERIRTAIARAIMLDPAILLLEDPSAGLDRAVAATLNDVLVELNKMLLITVVVATDDLASIFRIANRVLLLDAAGNPMAAPEQPKRLHDTSPDPRVREFLARQKGDEELYP